MFSEFPNVLKTFSELDQRADVSVKFCRTDHWRQRITADLNIAINKSEPVFHTRIDLLIDDRKADLETLRNRTSPWRAIVQEALEDLQSRGLHERIERIKGAGEERNDGDMLSILERYSEHIENELRQQIATLKAQLAEQRFKRSLRLRCESAWREGMALTPQSRSHSSASSSPCCLPCGSTTGSAAIPGARRRRSEQRATPQHERG